MLNNTEILKVAEVVSQEKGIEMDIVMEALEESFEIIGKSKYGMENNIKASIDRFTGNISMSHIKDVVETIDPDVSLLEKSIVEGEDPVRLLQTSVYGVLSKSHVPWDWSANWVVNFI